MPADTMDMRPDAAKGTADTMEWRYGMPKGTADTMEWRYDMSKEMFPKGIGFEPVFTIGSDGTVSSGNRIKMPKIKGVDVSQASTMPYIITQEPEDTVVSDPTMPYIITQEPEDTVVPDPTMPYIITQGIDDIGMTDPHKAALERDKNDIRMEYFSDMLQWQSRHPDDPMSFNDWLDSKVKDVVQPGFPADMSPDEYAHYITVRQDEIDKNGYPFGMSKSDMEAWHSYSDDWDTTHPGEPAPGIEEFLQWREDNVTSMNRVPGFQDEDRPSIQLPQEILDALDAAAEDTGMEPPYHITISREDCPELFDKIDEMMKQQQEENGLVYPGGSKYFNEATGQYDNPDNPLSDFIGNEDSLNPDPAYAPLEPDTSHVIDPGDVVGRGGIWGGVTGDVHSIMDENPAIAAAFEKLKAGEDLRKADSGQRAAFLESFNTKLADIDLDEAFANMDKDAVTLTDSVSEDYDAGVESVSYDAVDDDMDIEEPVEDLQNDVQEDAGYDFC